MAASLQNLVESLSMKNSVLEDELTVARKSGDDTMQKLKESHEILLRCIKENLGFKEGKPVAACIIYKYLLHWRAFESERTATFNHVIEAINDVLKNNLQSNGLFTAPSRRSVGAQGLGGEIVQTLRSPSKLVGRSDGLPQLTACVENIFEQLRDNLKKEISPLLSLCIQAPKTSGQRGKAFKSPGTRAQAPSNSNWDNIVNFLDLLIDTLCDNHVPSFFIRKLVTQLFSFVNIQLFNSLLLRREICTMSNGEYVKAGLSLLEKWITNVTEEFAGTSWHELNYIRQAVGFLVIHQKRKKTFEEIRQDLCPALSVRQIYRICSMYWDDKYHNLGVSNECVAAMREMVHEDTQNLTSNSLLLDDDLTLFRSPTEDLSMAIPAIDYTDVGLPESIQHYPSVQFLHRQ
ncbi:hypothetical protein EJB05_40140 [Eragrostis curvula]|uniref:Dilute domain-containing protein n=1 Tax=Eragrostis curvula TaxID=38414 RepID=A0A5J9TYW4_9POAL|nr:hypothetical protein EJB05_40140 [Eragrostis curvula]